MTTFIQGLAVPLDTKNVNGWGVPTTESANVFASFKGSTLKICPGEAHLCDYNNDPFGIIGHFDKAWLGEGGIHASYAVTDSVAERKLKEGSWKDFKWSMHGDSAINPKLNDGWTSGTTIKSMTLVKKPAWSQAHYQIAASDESGKTELYSFSDFTITASQNTGSDNIATCEEELASMKTKMGEMQKNIDDMTKQSSVHASENTELTAQVTKLTASITEKETEIEQAKNKVTELSASVDELNKNVVEKTTLVASLEKEKAGSVPMDQLKTIIAAAIEEHDTQLKAVNVREDAFKLFASAREGLGLETKVEDFSTLSAADLTKLATDLGTVKISASTQIKYPTSENTGTSDFATGAYDKNTRTWSK